MFFISLKKKCYVVYENLFNDNVLGIIRFYCDFFSIYIRHKERGFLGEGFKYSWNYFFCYDYYNCYIFNLELKKEKLILDYLDARYGGLNPFETENCISIRDVGLYGKCSKIVGFTGYVHAELVDWFGEGRYYPELKKWFCKKCEIDDDVMVIM